MLCEDLSYSSSSCGDILFYGYLNPPNIPIQDVASVIRNIPEVSHAQIPQSVVAPAPPLAEDEDTISQRSVGSSISGGGAARPGQMVRVPETTGNRSAQPPAVPSVVPGGSSSASGHSRNSSWDLRVNPARNWASQSRTASLDMRHSRNSSADLNKFIRNDIAQVLNQTGQFPPPWQDPLRVQIIKAHSNWICVSYAHFLCCYRLKDSVGWQLVFTSPHIEQAIERVALNAKVSTSAGPGAAVAGEPGNNNNGGSNNNTKMLAISYGSHIRLWAISEDGTKTEIGTFTLTVRVEYLFFIGSQLVALSSSGKIGVWHAMTQHWQTQDLEPISSFDTAGSFLLLGCNNGSIYYIGK